MSLSDLGFLRRQRRWCGVPKTSWSQFRILCSICLSVLIAINRLRIYASWLDKSDPTVFRVPDKDGVSYFFLLLSGRVTGFYFVGGGDTGAGEVVVVQNKGRVVSNDLFSFHDKRLDK